jgi:hypothetical protein
MPPVTLTLYSSSFCAACARTRMVLNAAASLLPDRVSIREVNVATDPTDTERRGITFTPTTVLTDAEDEELERAAGVPTAPHVLALLARHLPPASTG